MLDKVHHLRGKEKNAFIVGIKMYLIVFPINGNLKISPCFKANRP